MKDFVAATLHSGPAARPKTSSAIADSGELTSFTSASTQAPASLRLSTVASRSGLRPDWEIAMHSAPSTRRDEA